MRLFKKYIFTGFAPNLLKQDVKTSCGFLFNPFNWGAWCTGGYPELLEDRLKKYFQVKHASVFDSGRSALYFALKTLEVGEGDEVLVQSFTCVVVINAIKFLGATPVYGDINDDFNLNPDDLLKKLSPRAKVLIIQHTFGQSADLAKILAIAKEYNLKTIEDCAHALGGTFQGKLLGTFADIGMFSFGSDKVLSGVRGGALITNDSQLHKELREYQAHLPLSTRLKFFQHLMHNIFFFIGKPIYGWGVGKWLLALGKKLNVYNRVVYQNEKLGLPVMFYPAKFPNALAKQLFNKFEKLPEVIKRQKMIAGLYEQKIVNPKIKKPEWKEENIWLRYTILVDKPRDLHRQAKKQGIILGNWYDAPVAPLDIDLEATDYKIGSCPRDEELSKHCVNLPTDINITESDAKRIINLVNTFL